MGTLGFGDGANEAGPTTDERADRPPTVDSPVKDPDWAI